MSDLGSPPPYPPPAGPFPGPPVRPGPQRRRGRVVALVALALVGLGIVVASVVTVVRLTGQTDEPPAGQGRVDEPRSDEELIESAITEGFTRWAAAEGGDKRACEGVGDYVDWGIGDETSEERCLDEVGSNTDASLESVEVDRIEIDGTKASARVELAANSDSDDQTITVALTKDGDRWRVDGD